MIRPASTLSRIINVFVLFVAAFLLLAANRSWTQNIPLFLPPVIYSSGGELSSSLALGDLNGDGKLDIVATNFCVPNCEVSTAGGFGVLLGNGDGTFQPTVVYSLVGGTAGSVALGDLNGDGKLDVVVSATPAGGCSAESGIGVFLGNGDGTFQPERTYKSGGLCANYLLVADVNEDGKPDVLVANGCGSDQGYCSQSIDGVIAVLRGNGDGSLEAAQTYDSGGVGPRGITVADVNADGKLDLLVANGGSEQLGDGNGNAAVLLGNGDGTFKKVEIFNTFSPYAGGLASLAVADLNGDGKLDVVETTCFSSTCFEGTGAVVVQLGNGDGTFQVPQVYNSGGYLPTMVALADVNLDGKLDAVVVNTGECRTCVSGGVTVLLGNGDGTFSPFAPSRKFSSGGAASFSAALGDVNRDGRLDVVIANAYTLCGPSCNTPAGVVGVLLGAAKFPTTTSFVSSLNPSIYGQPVTFVARVTHSGSFQPTGTVKFKWGIGYSIGTAALKSDGTATLTRSNLNADPYPLTAVYSGDADNLSSTSSVVNQIVTQTTSAAALTSSLNPSRVGEAVTFTARISSPTVIAKGPVTFTTGKMVLGTAQLSGGKAQLAISSLPVGSIKVTVTYYGDSNIAKSSASVIQTVQ
jgi:uncharacterized protein YuzB (UPF0349 family)